LKNTTLRSKKKLFEMIHKFGFNKSMSDSEKALDFILASRSSGQESFDSPVLMIGGDLEAQFDHFYTPYKDQHDWLIAKGKKPVSLDGIDHALYSAVFIIGTKQKQETAYYLASGLRAAKTGALVIVSLENDRGGKSLDKMFSQMGCPFESFSKHKSRIVWTTNTQTMGVDACQKIIETGAKTHRVDGQWTQAGVFSWDRLDKGSQFLMETVHPELWSKLWSGRGADFGGGCGDLTKFVLEHAPSVSHLAVLEYDARSVDCARLNLERYRDRADCLWLDIISDTLPTNLDFIIMNPPFHDGKEESVRIGQSFISKAAQSLKSGGNLTLVANVHLPYEKILQQKFIRIETLGVSCGFKVLLAYKP
jgi:16S rRNA (guanine1207-N2)-methyltransferase